MMSCPTSAAGLTLCHDVMSDLSRGADIMSDLSRGADIMSNLKAPRGGQMIASFPTFAVLLDVG